MVHGTVDLEWLVKLLMFPLGLLWWLEVKLTEAVGVPGPGHPVLPEPWKTAVYVAVPILQISFVASVIYVLLGVRARSVQARLAERA